MEITKSPAVLDNISPATRAEGATLLVVEDNRDTLKTLIVLLKRRGFKTIEAVDVASGIEAGQTHSFDLLLSDIGLPDGSGCDVLIALRKFRTFPAIALTAYCTLEDIAGCRNAGFNLHIAKPYDFQELDLNIRKLLAGRVTNK